MNGLRLHGATTTTRLAAAALMLMLMQARPAIAAVADHGLLTHSAAAAISDDAGAAKDAVAALRAAGPAGLAMLMSVNADTIERHRAAPSTATFDPAWRRLCCAIDAVAAQRDAYSSGLYWYTDIDAAQAAAAAQGKPILSLRLLGKLNEEFSCANSRFFRTTLYANAEVSRVLREQFILHWQSVRPVPRITIDFGDGRKVERTITGNSIHYVLRADGTVIDAIPGLFGPTAFLRELTIARSAEALNGALAAGPSRDSDLRLWHVRQHQRIVSDWDSDLKLAGATSVMLDAAPVIGFGGAIAPPALAAAPRAVSKGFVELNIVRQLAPAGVIASAAELESRSNEATWAAIAAFHAEDSRLDRGSRALIAAKQPQAVVAEALTRSKMAVETPLVRLVANFERSIAQDTVRNQYLFHSKIHQWLANADQAQLTSDVNALNERVYGELFLTPSSDPWLGLVPADTYSALDSDGVR